MLIISNCFVIIGNYHKLILPVIMVIIVNYHEVMYSVNYVELSITRLQCCVIVVNFAVFHTNCYELTENIVEAYLAHLNYLDGHIQTCQCPQLYSYMRPELVNLENRKLLCFQFISYYYSLLSEIRNIYRYTSISKAESLAI